jgi:25S rRNA (adenine2142-N1)-methyltransferase
MTTSGSKSNRKRGGKSAPLAPPPMMKSRKKARKVTTLFHKYTRERDTAQEQGKAVDVERLDRLIEEMGGRTEYQRASQVSTSFHSTSKWVLGVLSRNGWLHGIVPESESKSESEPTIRNKKCPRRNTLCLEVGAINTELLDAAASTVTEKETGVEVKKYRLQVKAVDIHSMHPGIEEADFLTMPIPSQKPENRYDCVVCSMVLNCVTFPEQRGIMLARLYHFLRPNGLAFITIPKLCLTLSRYTNQARFQALLKAVGFEITETKESPKVAFFICRRPASGSPVGLDSKWTKLTTIFRGKKYRNDFSVVLNETCVTGHASHLTNGPEVGEEATEFTFIDVADAEEDNEEVDNEEEVP